MKCRNVIAGFALVSLFTLPAAGQEERIDKDNMQTLALGNLLVPSSNEVFSALEKSLPSFSWQGIPSYNTKKAYSNRAVVALNLGIRVADGFIAIKTKDRDKLMAMGETAKSLAENLGIKDLKPDVMATFKEYTEKRDWKGLVLSLDNFQAQYMKEMQRLGDPDLTTLASLGGWIQGMYLVSHAIEKEYSEQSSMLLYQPHLVAYFKARLEALNSRNKQLPIVKRLLTDLDTIASLVNVGANKPVSKQSVSKIKELSTALTNEIQKG